MAEQIFEGMTKELMLFNAIKNRKLYRAMITYIFGGGGHGTYKKKKKIINSENCLLITAL